MEYIDGTVRKSYGDHFRHFQLRLKQRYNLKIDRAEYELSMQKFNGVFKKSKGNTIGWIMIQCVKVWVLYRSDLKCFTTCYPSNIESDVNGALYACFGGSYRYVGLAVYNAYLEECKTIRQSFDDEKDAAVYFFDNTLFPTLHMDKYKHGSISLFKVMFGIRRVMLGECEFLKLTVAKKA